MSQSVHPSLSRRDLLEGGLGCLLAGAGLGGLQRLLGSAAHAAGEPASDYRALVCVCLDGGNDSFNLLVPTDNASYREYAASRGNLAIAQNQLLSIAPRNPQGRSFGLHPAVPELRSLFAANRLAFVVNVGTLLVPTSKAQYRSGQVAKPLQLFSHSDQLMQWEAQSAAAEGMHGWAGRVADLLLSRNNGSPLSPSITLAGATRLLQGNSVVPYVLGVNGSIPLRGFDGGRGQRRFAAFRQLLDKRHGHPMESHYAAVQDQAMAVDELLRGALAGAPNLATVFPNSGLGNQLKMVARMVSVRAALGMGRQVFFVRMRGFDTHSDQMSFHPQLLGEVSRALAAFHDAMVELGTASMVTTFTTSEFGRTLTSNGNGSDHGWGGNQLVMGGAVSGGDLYGTWPSLQLDGPDDVGQGRVLPSTAVEQMSATLATWFGVAPSELASVFPRLGQFARSNLGFMA